MVALQEPYAGTALIFCGPDFCCCLWNSGVFYDCIEWTGFSW